MPDSTNCILVAEGHVASRQLLERNLEYWGYDVMVVADGSEALRLLELPGAPCIALLDCNLLRASGLEVCRRVRAQKERPYQYLMLFGNPRERDGVGERHGGGDRDGVAAGENDVDQVADEFVCRPVSMEQLRARLTVARRVVGLERDAERVRQQLKVVELEAQELREILPVCMACGRRRNSSAYWRHLDTYTRVHGGDADQGRSPVRDNRCAECLASEPAAETVYFPAGV